MKFRAYPKIPSLKNLVLAIKSTAEYVGKDSTGEPLFDESIEKPTIKFTGTVKLHGTNAGIMYDGEKIQPIKRSTIVTGGHMGFWEWCQENEELKEEMHRLYEEYAGEDEYIIVYGEWVGPGIQKGVAISNLNKKMFFAFDLKVVVPLENLSEYKDSKWVDITKVSFNYLNTVADYESYEVEINFNAPKDKEDTLTALVEKIEELCPIASKFGQDGVGEGIVWKGNWNNTRWVFKTKGEKHKVVKDSKKVKATPEVLAGIEAFVDYAVTEARVLQGIQTVEQELERVTLVKSDTPHILKWISQDILAEELGTLKANGQEWKDVQGAVSKRTREMFFKYLDNGTL